MKFRILICVLCISNALSLFSQDSSRHHVGFSLGYGCQCFMNAEYEYNIYLFQFQYYRQLIKKKSWGINLILSPHFVSSKFFKNDKSYIPLNGLEFGLNGGVLIRKTISKDVLNLYLQLSAGPHYVSDVPDRQRIGFIFSDNASIGALIKLDKGFYGNLGVGIRHISNANTRLPNDGINNMIFSFGIVLALDNHSMTTAKK